MSGKTAQLSIPQVDDRNRWGTTTPLLAQLQAAPSTCNHIAGAPGAVYMSNL